MNRISGWGKGHSGAERSEEPGIHNHERFNGARLAPRRTGWGYGFRARDFVAPRNDSYAFAATGSR